MQKPKDRGTPGKQVYERFLNRSPQATLQELKTSPKGLESLEAKQRLKKYGANVLKAHDQGAWAILARQFKSPFIYLLIAAALIAFFLKDAINGTLILVFVLINTALGFFQEYHSEHALRTLRKYTVLHAIVLRDGVKTTLPVEHLVPGDSLELHPGDIVPADMRLLETSNLSINESPLTGEAEPTFKTEAPLSTSDIPIHEARNIAFSATIVVSGHGSGVVIATGPRAYIGTITKSVAETPRVSSFEKGIGKFSTFILRLVGLTLTIVFFANLLIKGSAVDIGNLLIFSIALATAVIPEALPLVITFSLSRGALRLARHRVVVKRMSAIEDLGGIEVLCTDKTGTLTENKLTVVEVYGDKERVLARAISAISRQSESKDAFDIALEEAAATGHITHVKLGILDEIPFDPDRKRNSVVVHTPEGNHLIVRGAAEAIIPYLEASPGKELKRWVRNQGAQGRRVIVIAEKPVARVEKYSKTLEETGLKLIGAIAFTDPLKKTTLSAVKKARTLGVSIKIVTGDSPGVAGAVAHEIGLVESSKDVVTAEEFFALSPAKQRQAIEKLAVFARFSPQQKHELIDLIAEHHEVGFLGEGINDAPALKSANVALAVQGASDIAKEAADVILLHRSLEVIIDGIQEGREVFTNTIKYVKMTLASNFGNFYAVAIASLIVDFLPMLPIQILLVNLLSDFPLIAIATDSVSHDDIKSPETYNLKDVALVATVLGLVSTVFDFIFFGLFYRISPAVLQTNWFMASILTELTLLFSLRTRKPFFKATPPSPAIIVLSLVAALVTMLIPATPVGSTLFQFMRPSPLHMGMILGLVLVYFLTTEAVKLAYLKISAEWTGARKRILRATSG